ncbi:lytic murein transglycosylase [Shewanella fidelis]|uniref:lytic murein transglycosylase n=1 Tax=Shewanella fidelis TaxID=173509 RepID=UPI0004AFDAB3|nr:lytic murein transglycosylase [Shewanella fidelis]
MLSGKHAFVLFSCICLLPLFATAQTDSRGSFSDYVQQLKQDALEQGVSQQLVDNVFPKIKLFKKAQGLKPIASAVPVTLDTYLPQAVSPSRVEWTRALYSEYQLQLDAIAKRYDVQPRFIVALFAIDSNFGQLSSDYPALSVTASLAYAGEKEDFYRQQFINALQIIERDKLNFAELKSNAKGQLGLSLLLPSRYAQYAKDGDDDGKSQPWSNPSDAFASIAYYLQQKGWRSSQTWGRQVRVPNAFDLALIGLETSKSFSEWQNIGVRRFNGKDLPNRDDMQVSMVMPDGEDGRKYLVYDNYRYLTDWSNDNYFAISVAYLSEKVKQHKAI